MSTDLVADVPRTRVVLPSDCTLKEAAFVRRKLMEGLEATGDVELDAGSVKQIDTSVLQLLASFMRDMLEAGRSAIWVGCTPECGRAASQLGLDEALGRNGAAGE